MLEKERRIGKDTVDHQKDPGKPHLIFTTGGTTLTPGPGTGLYDGRTTTLRSGFLRISPDTDLRLPSTVNPSVWTGDGTGKGVWCP